MDGNGNNTSTQSSEVNPYVGGANDQEQKTMEQKEPQVYEKEYDLISSLETFERDFQNVQDKMR